METNARYTLIGSFVLAVTLALFAFVYWLHNTGGLGDRQMFQVRFQSSVSGLVKGASVLFNGIRVGEVTDIELSPDAPKDVLVTLAVDKSAPVRSDTVVNVDFQGLTGAPVIELSGGAPGASPLAASNGAIPLLTAGPESTETLTQSARGTLTRLDKVIDDNSAALHDAIAGISTFAGVLSRNSERIDGILAGLERFAGGAKTKPGIYNLSARSGSPVCPGATRPQLVVPEPAAPMAFNSDKVVVLGAPPDGAPFEKAQFTDNIPAVVQAKVIESFENSGCFDAVTRPIDNLEQSDQLQTEIRQFAILMKPQPTADVEITVKLVSAGGKILGSRVFDQRALLSAVDAPSAVAALDTAFGKVLADAVPWVAQLPRAPASEKDAEPAEPDAPEPPAP
ncbi:ABC-type transport auxiliary lipoprotein family protein [Hyphomicrobium sp.]|uniref:ABC-type transport auxiliary lipoprotein family protein n=1 Tax=Hyphomicrobium sp. TaxID=82 RepID=UPI002E303B23|nr:MlaD family protein [Hyphomicrobium sp.]HEX2842855.1 MlaD family protein [Hyphomicrobium sp.]